MGYGTWQDSPLTSGTEPFRALDSSYIYIQGFWHQRGGLDRRRKQFAGNEHSSDVTIDWRTTHMRLPVFSATAASRSSFLSAVFIRLYYIRYGMKRNTHMPNQKRNYTHSVYHTHTHTYKHTHTYANSFVCYFIFSTTSSQGKKITSTHLLYVENVLVWICPRIFRSIPQHCAEVADEMPQKSVKFLWFQPFLCGQSGKRKK